MGVSRISVNLLGFLFAFAIIYLTVCSLLVPLIELGDPIPASFTADYQDDPSHVLADLYSSPNEGDPRFFFGVANSAGQVEDNLNDSWLDLARGDSGKVRAFKNFPLAEERLRFWSEPEVDLTLAANAGASVFRMNCDWGRIIPEEPVHGTEKHVDWKAVNHYRDILQQVHERGMKVMLTIFHFALPKWAEPFGGWKDERMVQYYKGFTILVKREFGEYIDYWITFNEPNIFVIFTYCTRSFPSSDMDGSLLTIVACLVPRVGTYHRALDLMTKAHILAYDILHDGDPKPVGLAHFGVLVRSHGLIETPGAVLLRYILSYTWLDKIVEYLDFCGINYYGREIGSFIGLMVDNADSEYSEAGRGVFPNGLYEVLTSFHKRYKKVQPNMRYIITENGVGDATDKIRRPFLIEHMLAISAARDQGVPVDGYIYWTISDNMEWIDGYCPRFGLVAVDRDNNLQRNPRSSYYLFQQLSATGKITAGQRQQEWDNLQLVRKEGMLRPFCREYNSIYKAGIESSDVPFMRPLSDLDWRFGSMKAMGVGDYAGKTATLVYKIIRAGFQELGRLFKVTSIKDSEGSSHAEL